MRYVCLTCGALRDDGDAPFGRQDCRWYRREPVPEARRHQVRTLVLVAVLMATAVSTISAMRLNPMAVSTMIEDRRWVKHAMEATAARQAVAVVHGETLPPIATRISGERLIRCLRAHKPLSGGAYGEPGGCLDILEASQE
jgi:hypothetical protein